MRGAGYVCGVRAPITITLLALSTIGCGGGCSGASDAPPRTESAQRTEAAGGEDHAEPAIDADPGPVPVLRLRGEVDRHDRRVAIHVENHGTEAIELRTAVALEREDGDDWDDVSAALTLRDTCAAEASECITLAPGAVYIPPAWTGQLGDAQCECERCAPAPAGTYRLIVTSCSGAHRVEGEPIVLP